PRASAVRGRGAARVAALVRTGRALLPLELEPVELVELLGPLEVLGDLVDDEQRVVDLAGAVAGPAQHVRGDRPRHQLERDDEQQGDPRGDAAQLDPQAEHEEHEAEHLRLGRRVHAGEQVGEADDAEARDEGEQRPADEQEPGDDVEDGVGGHRSLLRCSSSSSASTETMTDPLSSSSSASGPSSCAASRCERMSSSSSLVRMRPSSADSAAANRAMETEPMKPTRARTMSTGTRSPRLVAAAMIATVPMRTAVVTSTPRMRSNMLGPRSTRDSAMRAAASRMTKQMT